MFSNIPLMNLTGDKVHDEYMAHNKVPSLDKSGSDSKTGILEDIILCFELFCLF